MYSHEAMRQLIQAIDEAGEYEERRRAEVTFSGIPQGDNVRGRKRFTCILSEKQTDRLIRLKSYDPIWEVYGINPDLIMDVEVNTLTIRYVEEGEKQNQMSL